MRNTFFLIFFFLAGASSFDAHGSEENSKDALPFSADELETCLALESDRIKCYVSLCDNIPSYVCAENILDAIVAVTGPEKGMMELHDIMQNPEFAISTDGHLLAHVIGRSLSKNYGPTGKNFLQCPPDFNNGCFHGFFEDTLVKVNDPLAVATDICESLPEGTSRKEKWYCYHGAGHVFMINEAYDINRSLQLCLSLDEPWAEACWQGLFMENAIKGYENREENFREEDPLYPCNAVQDKFKPQCYINHHSHLLDHYSTSLNDLIEVCLYAGDFAEHCLGGVALYLPDPYALDKYGKQFGITNLSYGEKIVFLCNRFPKEYVESCYDHAVAGILNEDAGNLERSSSVCKYVENSLKRACFESIGKQLPHLIPEKRQIVQACTKVPAEYRKECIGTDSDHGKDSVSDGSSGQIEELYAVGRFSFLKNPPGFVTRLIRFLQGFFKPDEGTANEEKPPVSDTNHGRNNEPVKTVSDKQLRVLTPEAGSLSGKEGAFPGVKKSENAVIRYVNGAYVPDTVHVAVGSEVKWVSEDNAFWPASNLHPTHTAYPGSGITKCYTSQRETIFDACEALGRGVEYSFTFNSTGEWRFHDHINPKATGTIVVSN